MKKFVFLPILGILLCMNSCVEEKKVDTTAPGSIELKEVVPINGGFEVSYTLPTDDDLLYIAAEYQLTDGADKRNVKSSIYEPLLKIEGFGDTLTKTVQLYAVDRSENYSEPVEFTEAPLSPPTKEIIESLTIHADYGGVKFTWINILEVPVALIFSAEDSTGVMQKIDTYYTSAMNGKTSIRGFDPEPTKFSVVIRDRWDNLTNSRDTILTPLFEERLDKSLFNAIFLGNDTYYGEWEGRYENGYDDNISTIVHTMGGEPWPQIYSIDLGLHVKLSRFNIQGRQDYAHFEYSHGAPKKFDVYGATTLGDESGNLADWTLLREECVCVKPSGLPMGQYSDEDRLHWDMGDEFTFDEPVEIRYFRLAVKGTWDGAGYVDFSELSFWGDVVE